MLTAALYLNIYLSNQKVGALMSGVGDHLLNKWHHQGSESVMQGIWKSLQEECAACPGKKRIDLYGQFNLAMQ